jgi:sorting nexin-8
MSLFGTTPPSAAAADPSSVSRSSLFEDESGGPEASTSRSSLFANDDSSGPASSPWDLPTPKKASRAELVQQLLSATEVPESYIDTFDSLVEAGEVTGAGVSLKGVTNLLRSSSLSTKDQARVLEVLLPKGHELSGGLRRGEFNVLLALIGLGQEGEVISLDGVDERRKSK